MAGSEPVRKGRPTEAEERLLVEAAQRDPSLFADLYENYFGLVYAYVTRRVRSRDEAEDLTSEVFRKALASLPRFKWRGAPFAVWLFKIASNMIADRAKRVMREGGTSHDVADRRPAREVSVTNLSDSQKSAHTSLEEVERQAQLFRLVGELADDQRRVVVMRFAEEKSIREIATELGRSEGAVKQLQFRALENLRAKLPGDR
jgi:RNA polymerase sigma-70 factor (ECF subfamily)